MADVNISKYRASVVRDGSKPASPGFVVSEGQDPVNPPGTNNFVPYTGATANVELGEFGVEAGFVTLDTTPTNIPTDQGAIYWDDTRSTAALIMNGTLQHIGQDSFFYVKNSSGSTIPKGTCVGFAGTDGGSGHLLVTPFLANGSVPSTYFMGVTAEAIANGAFGQVMHFGELEGINTSGFTAGALLYASSTVAGAFQTTAPVAPNNIILVAAAVNSKNNGAIVVRPTLGSNFGTNESVKLTSVTDKDLLQYQSGTGVWENKTLAQVIGSAYVPSTRTITINGTALDLSVDRSWSVGDMLLNTYQVVTGTKVFGTNRLIMEGEGTAQPTSLSNTQTSNSALASHNSFGFNGSNNIYFNKGTTANGGIFAFSNTATRTYTLKDASGTLAFTSDIPSLSGYVQGSGTTNYVSKFTGSGTIGNSQIFDNGTNVGINQASPTRTVDILGASGIGTVLKLQGASGTTTYLQLAYNGATNAQSGYIGYNSSSQMQFFTNDTLALTIDSNRNLGLGVTPSAWGSINKVFETTAGTIMLGRSDLSAWGRNFYYNSADAGIYTGNGHATGYFQSSGQHFWVNAPSGTAGNAISFTQAMTLTGGGNLLVGTTTDNGARLQVSGTSRLSGAVTINQTTSEPLRIERVVSGSTVGRYSLAISSGGNLSIYDANADFDRLTIAATTGAATFSSSVRAGTHFSLSGRTTSFGYQFPDWQIYNTSGGGLAFNNYSTDAMTITSSGNVGIGTNTPTNARLVISNSANDKISLDGGSNQNGMRWEAVAGANGFYLFNGTISSSGWGLYNINTAASPFWITNGGNFIIGTTTDNGARLQVNGDILTSAPSGGTAGKWKLGTATSGSYTIGGKIRIEINGVAYDILTT